MNNKVTIIVPVYNTEQYLDKCLSSIINQTYENLEIVVVDDGSTDGSNSLCNKFNRLDERVVFIEQGNCGVSAARNVALGVMTGDFLCFIDSDDWIEPTAIDVLLGEMIENDVDVVYYNTILIKETDSVIRVSKAKEGFVDRIEMIKHTIIPNGYFLSVHNKMFRVESLKKQTGQVNLFDTTISILEDGVWLMENLVNMDTAYLDPRGWYNRSMRADSAMGEDSAWFERAIIYLNAYEKIIERIDNEVGDAFILDIAKKSYFGYLSSAIRRVLFANYYDKNSNEITKEPSSLDRQDLFSELMQNSGENLRMEFMYSELRRLNVINNSRSFRVGRKIVSLTEKSRIIRGIFKFVAKVYKALIKIRRK